MDDSAQDLARIGKSLAAARVIFHASTPEDRTARMKGSGDPVTPVEQAINSALRETLCRDGDGWLSEETADDASRLSTRRVWIVDPIDGTREFLEGVPEYAVSVALVVDGEPAAGGVLNPATDELFLGARGRGVTRNGSSAAASARRTLEGAVVLASRSEWKRGEWERFSGAPFTVRPMGSAAYKLACVASGLADATWTFVPKHEWDIAGGLALLAAAGGRAVLLDGTPIRFNRSDPGLSGFVATTGALFQEAVEFLKLGRA